MRLVDGALAIAGDLPASATTIIDVPLEAGVELGTGVARCGSIALVRDRVRDAMNSGPDSAHWPLTIGGDCGSELGAVSHVLEQAATKGSPTAPGDIAVVWFDAHPDLNTPFSSPSGAFGGMVLRALTGDGPPELVPRVVLDPRLIVLAGVRDINDDEADYITEHSIGTFAPNALGTPGALIEAIAATGATSVYVHIDLDVLDPSELAGQDSPVPFGMATAHLLAAVRQITANFTLLGAGISQFAPASPDAAGDDLPTILRIVGALTA
jgi:arginase